MSGRVEEKVRFRTLFLGHELALHLAQTGASIAGDMFKADGRIGHMHDFYGPAHAETLRWRQNVGIMSIPHQLITLVERFMRQ